MRVEYGQAERAGSPGEPSDDRCVILDKQGRYGLFDGAGQHVASEAAARAFRAIHSPTNLPPLYEVFQTMHASVVELQSHSKVVTCYEEIGFEANLLRTTATAIGLRTVSSTHARQVSQSPIFEYMSVGDSSLYLFEAQSAKLSKMTRDDTFDHFLGAPALSATDYTPRNRGGFLLRSTVVAALVSDGITADNPWKGAVSDQTLAEILSETAQPQAKAEAIVAASTIADDASVIVVEAEP